jgi:hypothetical protein
MLVISAGFGFEIHKVAFTGKFGCSLLQITIVATGVEVSDYQQGSCTEVESCKSCRPKLTFFSASRLYAREFEGLLGSDEYGVWPWGFPDGCLRL